MNEGICYSGQLEGIRLCIVMPKYKDNQLTNLYKNSKIKKISNLSLMSRSMSILNKGQGQPGRLEGISLSIVMSKYEDNPLTYNNVIQKQQKQVFDLKSQGHL